VWEWCQDVWHENYENAPKDGSSWNEHNSQASFRTLRGGSWHYHPKVCRSANRNGYYADGWYDDIGFRLAVSIF